MTKLYWKKKRGKIPLLFQNIRDAIYSFSQLMKAKCYLWMSSLKVTRKINKYVFL